MLYNVPAIITPDLLTTLAMMGHGDWLAIVDGNYPVFSRHDLVHPLPGVDTVEALEAVLTLFPMDTFEEPCAYTMVPDPPREDACPAHEPFEAALRKATSRDIKLGEVPRTDFYKLAADKAFAAIQTTDNRPYSCFLICKGVIF